METTLKDKIAIITGAGRGIGRETALMMAARGARVLVSDIDAQPARETLAEIEKNKGQAAIHVGDAMAPGFAQDLVKTAAETFGGIHIIVNNAGYTWDAVIHRMTDRQWDTMMDLHIKAPFRIIRAAAPYFRDQAKKEMADSGSAVARKIVNISSAAGTNGNAGQANYSSAKAAVLGLTKTLAKEWGRFNVQCNAVAYGWIDTRLTRSKEETEAIKVGGQEVAVGIPAAQREALKSTIPLGRPGTAREAASVIYFLASPLSDYMTGQVLLVDGGVLM